MKKGAVNRALKTRIKRPAWVMQKLEARYHVDVWL
jgi:hypothetical protein